jgi:uncharacterized protein
MIKRDFEQTLTTWKDVSERRPLVLRGARQVGKSYTIREFARKQFDNYLEINFEKQPELKSIFLNNDVKKILKELSEWSNQEIVPGKSLLFIDELQECPEALLTLRYFYEDLPNLHVIGAGSLLDFILRGENEKVRVPVGRIEYRYLYPLSFKEFLRATNQSGLINAISEMEIEQPLSQVLHEKALQQIEIYLRIGGMPAAVSAYQKEPESIRYREVQAAITQTYREDFLKYKRLVLFATKQFKYSEISPDTQSRTAKAVLELFDKARIINKVFETSASGLPLDAQMDIDRFKFIFIDCGLLAQMQQIPVNVLQSFNLDLVNSGNLAEQLVGQELLTLLESYDQPRLYYWHRDRKGSQAEVDYLLALNGQILPIEVKAGKTGALRSLRIFMEDKRSHLGVRISQQQVSFVDNILSIPFYAISELPRLVGSLQQGKSKTGRGDEM